MILCKYRSIQGEVREKTLQGRKVAGSLGYVMKGRKVNLDIKKAWCDSIIVLTLMYTTETWMLNAG